jgi:hypothetical protein
MRSRRSISNVDRRLSFVNHDMGSLTRSWSFGRCQLRWWMTANLSTRERFPLPLRGNLRRGNQTTGCASGLGAAWASAMWTINGDSPHRATFLAGVATNAFWPPVQNLGCVRATTIRSEPRSLSHPSSVPPCHSSTLTLHISRFMLHCLSPQTGESEPSAVCPPPNRLGVDSRRSNWLVVGWFRGSVETPDGGGGRGSL